ncbi:6-chlorohydroxyquinol-1,2-dioxygenase [Tabrizicola sp. J26]|uniref:dioxygenase family protein n=1 Tax=Alitabrizicola rongguiensis TaxID=2909234 RepID=UPI001F2AA0C3|nr:dioxygenase [Tabrizicola rongguiensis]MCF1710310.1 6-chlorohydroxyquinol-1,2-dioxygenase [Tabrizicola rongguiensis]
MDGAPAAESQDALLEAFAERLGAAREERLAQGVLALVGRLHDLIRDLRPTPDEFSAVLGFLTDVGHNTDARRQEWVLLADVLGVSTLVEDLSQSARGRATPSTIAGPFYRPDAPDLPDGADLCRDGRGQPLDIAGQISDLSGAPIPQAVVEIWHANAQGCYENQQPDLQPEFNLRGRFRADASGRFSCRTIRPGGYMLPKDGPVGILFQRLGLGLERPAHIHFRVAAPGFRTLVTHVFDRDDPAIGRDALFAVKPELLGEFRPVSDHPERFALAVRFFLAPETHP